MKYNRYCCIISSIVIIFGYCIGSNFIYDDHVAIVKNADLNLFKENYSINIELFKHDFWGNDITDHSSHKSYRPLTVIVFGLIRKFSDSTNQTREDQINPFYFHLANILSYCFLCSYLYQTLINLFNCSILFKLNQNVIDDSAFKITLLFALHPIHSESVRNLHFEFKYLSIQIKNYFFKIDFIMRWISGYSIGHIFYNIFKLFY